MRRFEYIQANQAKFWEVSRRGATLTVKSGRIGGTAKERTKQLADYMAAEQEFDRLIRDKLRRGYVEVHEATEASTAIPDRWVRLHPVAAGDPLDLPAPATRYLAWRMIEVAVMDRQASAPDLGRWAQRAARRLRLEEVPEPTAPEFPEFRQVFLDLSAADRAAETGQSGVVGAYKLLEGTDWLVTAREAGWLADATRNRTPRRHKTSTNQEHWLAEWQAFHDRAASGDGYHVELIEQRIEDRARSRRARGDEHAVQAGDDASTGDEGVEE